jgi:hypothetical protein
MLLLQLTDPTVFTKNLSANQIKGFDCKLFVKNPLSLRLVSINVKVKIQENNCIRCIVRMIITREESIQIEGVRKRSVILTSDEGKLKPPSRSCHLYHHVYPQMDNVHLCPREQLKEDYFSVECSMQGETKNAHRVLVGKPEGQKKLEVVAVHGRIILKQLLSKWNWGEGGGVAQLRGLVTMARIHLVPLNAGNFLTL